jgi:WD40 repeat protein
MNDPPLSQDVPPVSASPSRSETVAPGPGGGAPELPRRFGDYELLGEIARGGMGVVCKARQVSLGRIVALKMILSGQLASAADLQRFRLEAEAAANLDHANIVPIYEVGAHTGMPFFSMKLIEGGSLAEAVGSGRWAVGSKEGQRRAARLVAAVAHAVHHAHQRGLLHRDLKPANILLDEHGEPHVTDFGLVRRVHSSAGLTQSGAIVGTPGYMAPEQAAARKDLSTAVDVYSLGAILYELLTGRPPFQAETPLDVVLKLLEKEPDRPRRLNPRIDHDLETVCLKCLEKEPLRRYPSAAALAEDLERWLRGEPILARPAGGLQRVLKWARRRPALAALSAAVVLVTGLGMAGIVWKWRDARAAEAAALAEAADAVAARGQAEQARLQAAAALVKEKAARQHVETERNDKQRALVRADGLRLAAEAGVARSADPALALLLALEGTERAPNYLTYGALYDALRDCREERTLGGDGPTVRLAHFSPDGRVILTAGSNSSSAGSQRDTAIAARVWDAAGGKLLATWPGYGMDVAALDCTPDGRRVAVALSGNQILHYPDGRQPDTYLFTDRTTYVWDTATGRDLVHLRRHDNRVVSVHFGPDGKKLLTASWDHTARLWDADTGKELHRLQGHDYSLVSALFSPDGRTVLTLSSNRTSESSYGTPAPGGGNQAALLEDPGILDRRGAVLNSPGGGTSSVNLAGEAKLARLWEADTGRELAGLTKNRPGPFEFGRVWHPTAAAFSPDGTRVAIAFEENDAALWDTAKGGAERAVLRGHQGTVRALAFSPDGKRLATAGEDGSVRVWDAATGKELQQLRGSTATITGVQFHPDGKRLLTASTDWTARLWDAQTGAELAAFRGHPGAVAAAAFSPDGRHVVTAGDTTARVWSVAPLPDLTRVLTGHHGPIRALAFTPDGRGLLSAGGDETPRLWDLATGQAKLLGEKKYLGEVYAAQLTADGRRVLTGSATHSASVAGAEVNASAVHLWDAATGNDLLTLKDLPSGARAARVSPDGRTIVTVSDGMTRTEGHGLVSFSRSEPSPDPAGTVCLWDAAGGKLLVRLPRPAWPEFAPVFNSDGGRLLLIAGDQSALLFDARTGQELFALRHEGGPRQGVVFAAFRLDGSRILTAGEDRSVCLWDATDGKRLRRLVHFEEAVRFAAFSPDGGRLVTLAGKKAYLWSVAEARLLRPLTGHEGALTVAAFSPDGEQVLAGTARGRAILWETATGKVLAMYDCSPSSVTLVAVAPDGKQVATGGGDGTVRLWPVDVLSAVRQRLPRALTAAERQRYDLLEPDALAAEANPAPADDSGPYAEPAP